MGIAEEALFGGRALTPEPAALAKRERLAELGFHQPGEREIEIVPTQQQVLSNGGAREIDAVTLAADADKTEIAGAAADIANQHRLAVKKQLARSLEIIRNPRIERGGGLLQKRELGKP